MFEIKDVNLTADFLCFLSFGYFHFYNFIEFASPNRLALLGTEYVLKTEAREIHLYENGNGFKIRVGDKMFLTKEGRIQMIETK